MESKGRVDDERGDLVEEIERDFISEGPVKEGEFHGLSSCRSVGICSPVWARGGKYLELNKGVLFPFSWGGEATWTDNERKAS